MAGNQGRRDQLTDEQRCTRTVRSTGLRCKNPHMPGVTVCKQHGNNQKQIENKAIRTRTDMELSSRMARLVTPVAEDDPDVRGDHGLHSEIRRTLARVRVLDEWVLDLREEQLGWNRVEGVRETETVSESMDGSFGNSETTKQTSRRKQVFEMRINVYVEWQMRERTHLVSLYKVWLAAGFKQRELDMLDQHIVAYDMAIQNILRALGLDPATPEVKNVIHQEMLVLTSPAKAITA